MKNTILITLLTFTLSVSAQEVAQLSLKEAITFALENKSEAKKAKLDIENSEYKIQEVRSRALPQISANGSMTYNPILQLNALPGDFFGAPGTTILAWRAVLRALPADVPHAIEYPLVGDDLVAVTREQVAFIRAAREAA